MPYDAGKGVVGALGGAGTGAAIGSAVPGIGTAIGAGVGGLLGLFGGLGGKDKQKKPRYQSTLSPQQQTLLDQAIQAGMGPGAGGAFGESGDYYRNLLSDNSSDFNSFAAPELRRFNEETVPGLSEQFAGFGAGGLGSSGFRNAQLNAGTDLGERLGAIRANLRQQGAAGLAGIGQTGLGNYGGYTMQQPQAGFFQNAAEGIGSVLPAVASSWLSRPGQNAPATNTPQVGQKNSPYQSASVSASPQVQPRQPLPSFNPTMRR